MAFDTDLQSIGAVIGGLVSLAYGSAFAVRKLQKQWANDGTAIHQASGTNDIIAQLRSENDRLAKVNDALAAKVNDLTLASMKQQDEALALHTTITGLKRQLTDALDRLEALAPSIKHPAAQTSTSSAPLQHVEPLQLMPLHPAASTDTPPLA